jgi:hypothetical protein
VGVIFGIGSVERVRTAALGPDVARARARATRDSGDIHVVSLVSGRTVDEDRGEDDNARKLGDEDLAWGTCRRARGVVIWLVCIL